MLGGQILIVENDAVLASDISRTLSGKGYTVLPPIASGERALELIGTLAPDLVLVDVSLPGRLTGIETVRQIQAQFGKPVILLAGDSDDVLPRPDEMAGVYGYLVKPVNTRELVALVAIALSKYRADQLLHDSEISYRGLFDSVTEAIYVLDRQGRFWDVNRGAVEMYGYPRECLIGKTPEFVAAPGKNDLASVLTKIQRAFAGEPQRFEFWGQRKNGEIFPKDVRLYRGTFFGQEVVIALAVDITERKRAEQAEYAQRSLAEALRDTAAALNSTLNFDQVLTRILDNVGRVVKHETVDIILIEGETTRVVGCKGFAERGLGEEVMRVRAPISKVATFQEMIRTGRPVIIRDIRTEPRWIAIDAVAWSRSYLGAPIRSKGSTLGFLSLNSSIPAFFTEDDAKRLQSFADQAAIALENARLLGESERHAREFAALHETTHDLASQWDIQALLHTVMERALVLIDAPGGGVLLYDAAHGDLELAVAMGDTASTLPIGSRLRLDEGMSSIVARTRQPMVVNDYQNWEHRRPEYANSAVAALMQVPMLYGGELIGVLSVSDASPTRCFTEADVQLLSLFAAQAASAVHNARLFQETQQRATQLALLYDAGLTLNRALEPGLVIEHLLEITRKAVHADYTEFFRYDPERRILTYGNRAGDPFDIDEDVLRAIVFSIGQAQGLVGLVAEERTPLYIPDVQADSRWLPFDSKTHSAFWVPVESEDQLRGILTVMSSRVNGFSPADQRLVALFANQVSVALEKAHLFEEVQGSLAMTTHLYALSTQILAATTLEETAKLVIRALFDGFAADIVSIHVVNPPYEIGYWLGERNTEPQKIWIQPRPDGLTTRALKSSGPITVNDPELLNPALREMGIQSAIVLPLRGDVEAQGVLFLCYRRAYQFSDHEIKILSLFANQAALAVKQARLMEETRRRADELALINQIAGAVNQPLAFADVLSTGLRELIRAVRANRGGLALLDETRERAHIVSDYDIDKGTQSIHYTLAVADNPWLEQILRERQPLVIDDTTHDQRLGGLTPLLAELGVHSALFLPLIAQDQVIGVIGLESTRQPHTFSDTEVAMAQTIAHQVATAIEKARLFEAEQIRRAELGALYELSRRLADSDSLDVILQSVVRYSVEMVHTTFARLAILEENALVIRAVYPAHRLKYDLGLGHRESESTLPRCHSFLIENVPAILRSEDESIGTVERGFLLLGLAQTLCLVPLRLGAHVVGVLMLGEMRHEDRESFTSEKLHLARGIADQAANAIHRANLHEQTERRLKQVQALHAIDMTINASLDLSVILNVLLSQVVAQLRVAAADILALNPFTQSLDFLAGQGFRTQAIERSHCYIGRGVAGRVALERRTIQIPNLRQSPEKMQRAALFAGEEFGAYYGVPLIAKGQIKGVLEVFQRSEFTADSDWLDLLEAMATQAAIALDNTELFNRLQRSNLELSMAYDATIEGWSRALDLRDKKNEGHILHIVEMTLRLAQVMGVRDQDLQSIRRGVLLHDIGKMGIPDSILLKPASLTDAEWEAMRRHPIYAYELISPITYLRPAVDIPYAHHERWNGLGYPRGLRGEQIPLPARIFAVVDVYDALISERSYRAAWSIERARDYIRENAGVLFDPRVVEKFLELENP